MGMMRFNGWDFIKLIDALRTVALPITTQDIRDVLFILNKYPELETKHVFRSVFIHREEDHSLFDSVWQLIFGDPLLSLGGNLSESNSTCSGHEGPACPTGHGKGLGSGGITLSLSDALKSFPNPIETKSLTIGLHRLPLIEKADFEEQVKYILGQSGYFSWINSIELAHTRGEVLDEEWMRSLELGESWKVSVRQALWRNKLNQENSWDYLREEHWRHKPLNRFTKQEETAVHQALRQMSKKLAVRPGWRKLRAHRGAICISAAIKETVRGNGIIQRLEYERRTLQRPELVVLCDVSNSVAPFSEFLLYLIKNIQLRFRKVRLFLFIDTLWDISYEPWDETEDMMEQIHSWGRKSTSGFTDYGEVFKEFSTNWLNEISSRATLLILGDARNNFRPAQADNLKTIYEKVRHIYWLNPLEKSEWQDRDNILSEYVPYCSQIVRCRTINDLWGIARKLF